MKQARIVNADGFHCFENGTKVFVCAQSNEGNYECESVEDGFIDNDFCPDSPAHLLKFRKAGFFQYVPVDQLQFI